MKEHPSTYRVQKRFSFCYGHRLVGYDGPCNFVHGHNGLLEISFKCKVLNDLGMVVDFSDIKEGIGQWIKDNLDHSFIVWTEDTDMLDFLENQSSKFYVILENTTAENILKCIGVRVQKWLEQFIEGTGRIRVKIDYIKMWETEDNCAQIVYE